MKRILLTAFFAVTALFALNVYGQSEAPIVAFATSAEGLPAKADDTFNVTITATLQPHWHIYSIYKKSEYANPTIITFPELPFELVGQVAEPEPKFDQELGNFYFEDEAKFMQTMKVPAGLQPGRHKLAIHLDYQTCNEEGCLPGMQDLEMWFEWKDGALSVASGNTETPVDTGNTTAAGPLTEEDAVNKFVKEGNVWAFIWYAVGFGFIALLTPCVFPMVPVTISYFTKHSHHSRGTMLAMSVFYYLSIIGVFTVFGLIMSLVFKASAGAFGATDFSTNGYVNAAIAVLFIVFALSLFGALDLALPSGLVNKFSMKGARGGYAGLFFMALVFTMVSFTCTMPLVGALIGLAAGGNWLWPLLGMFAFSATLGFPFFFLGAFPRALSSLPGSGGWMHTVKVTMGFIELIAAYKFLWAADAYFQWEFFTRSVVLASWVALFALTGFYLVGMIRMKDDDPGEQIGGVRLLFALFFLVVSLYLASGLFRNRELSGVVEAYLPRLMSADADGGGTKEPSLWLQDPDQAVAQAHKQQRPILYLFTGNP